MQTLDAQAASSEATGLAPVVVVTGNPNVGKSVIFHLLTGRYTTVSNYPGTTVGIDHGTMLVGGVRSRVSDTPGLNGLAATSEDELVARDLILEHPGTVIQVADAKNLARALTITLELAEVGRPCVLVLNMMDEARERGLAVDLTRLSDALGIPVIPMIATQKWGLDRLRRALPQAAPVRATVRYPRMIQQALADMDRLIPPGLPGRALAALWLAGDRAAVERWTPRLTPHVAKALTTVTTECQARISAPLGVLLRQARFRTAEQLAKDVMERRGRGTLPGFARWGRLAMHPVWGLAVLGAVLGLMYELVGVVAAQHGVEFLETVVFGRYFIPASQWMVHHVIPWGWLRALLVGEYGVLTMALPYAFAIILPIVTMFFLCFGFIEDVGYLPRLAVMANRGCRVLGLNGKAVLPLVLGLGCDTMATMTTRILDSRRDRLLVTLLLALGIPCSAQLGVILAMVAGQPPWVMGVWLGAVLAVLVLVGQIAARILPGEESPFLYEIPPLRWPRWSNVVVKTLGRVERYLREAVPLFFLGTLLLFALDAVGVLTRLERWAEPLVVGWLGLPPQAAEAFLVGFLRRDFGAAGLFALQRAGQLSHVQVTVSLVTITLFVPCIAQYFMMTKEHGWKWATGIAAFATGMALVAGGLLYRGLLLWSLSS